MELSDSAEPRTATSAPGAGGASLSKLARFVTPPGNTIGIWTFVSSLPEIVAEPLSTAPRACALKVIVRSVELEGCQVADQVPFRRDNKGSSGSPLENVATTVPSSKGYAQLSKIFASIATG